MLIPSSLPTIYDLVDPEANLAGFMDVAEGTMRSVSSYDIETLGGPMFVAADGTPIGIGNDCAPPTYLPSTALGELREKEMWALALAGASAYLAWILFFGKRVQGKDKYYGSAI